MDFTALPGGHIDLSRPFESCTMPSEWRDRLFLCAFPNSTSRFPHFILNPSRLTMGVEKPLTMDDVFHDISSQDAEIEYALSDATFLADNLLISGITIAALVALSVVGAMMSFSARSQYEDKIALGANPIQVAPDEEAEGDLGSPPPPVRRARRHRQSNRRRRRRHQHPSIEQQQPASSESHIHCAHCNRPHSGSALVCARCHRVNIDCFPTTTVTDERSADQNCVICLEAFDVDDQVVFLPCLHLYHKV